MSMSIYTTKLRKLNIFFFNITKIKDSNYMICNIVHRKKEKDIISISIRRRVSTTFKCISLDV